MTPNSINTKRIAKNTAFLYVRTFITMAISLYTSRVVLYALGVEDYGIYNVVGGFVAMLSMFVNSLSASSQRFFAYEMGQDIPQLPKIFSVTISVHLIITLAILLFFETIGLWFLNYKMNIVNERMTAANWVFQCSVFAFAINMISIPYLASIIAHERMGAFAFISIFEACAKLWLAYLLTDILSDKLIIYAVGMLFIALSLRLIYSWYCRTHFSECKFRFLYDKGLYKKLISFTGWNVFGASAGIFNTYGINILVNLFFDVTLNAARGVADQVSHAVNTFSGNFMMALNPQITKSYSAGNYDYMVQLIYRGAKYSVFLLWIISLPIIMQIDFILNLWLVEVPSFAPVFVNLAIIYAICNALSLTLYYGILATGNIKNYHIVVTIINLMAFPICFLAFYLNLSPEWGYWSAIIAMLLSLIGRIVMLHCQLPQFTFVGYVIYALFRVVCVMCITYMIAVLVNSLLVDNGFGMFICKTLLYLFINMITVYTIGLDSKERCSLLKAFRKIIVYKM